MSVTGGGLITNSRTAEPVNALPKVQAMKPMQAPQQAQQPQGGMISPQGAAPQPQQQQAAPQPQQPQGGPPQDPGAQQGQINDVANNALALLHDPSASKQFEELISQGPTGAAQATAAIYEQVTMAHEERGSPITDENASGAAEAIIQDISEIGVAMGSFAPEPLIDGMPASVMEYVARTSELLVGKYPALAQAMQEMGGEALDPSVDQSAQQLAQYIGQGQGNGQG